jgi:hypothetical protein
MKTFAVKHKTTYAHKLFIVAAESKSVAVAFCMVAETEWGRTGTPHTPNAREFEAELIEGVTSRKEGIKSKLYV